VKTTIRPGLTLEKLLRQIPAPYRVRLPRAQLSEGTWTLVQLALDRADVVTSRRIAKALARVDQTATGDRIVVIGANFTDEARTLLREREAVFVSLVDFVWTDASYARVRQLY
jgi:hypothetical protein